MLFAKPSRVAMVLATAIYSNSLYAESCKISESGSSTTLSQYSFTWTVQGVGHKTGEFANGDCWIVGPVTVTSITPASVNSGGWIKNGTQLNPTGGNGYDSETDYNGYSAALNVSPNITGSSLNVTTGSLVSAVSKSTTRNRPQLDEAAILTVLASQPAARSFRPPYIGSDKTIPGTADNLNYDILRSLAPVAGTPSLAEVTGNFERPWMEQNSSWTGRYLHPAKNQPDYGRDMARMLGRGLLSLHLNYTKAQKEMLYIRMVQYGIDVYGQAANGGVWEDLGGHNQGRKMPLILAGMALNNQKILAYASGSSKRIFQEDLQTWKVTSSDVGRTLYTADGRPREQYTSAHVGLAEWGEQHTRQPNRDASNWNAYYRDIVGSSIIGHALSAKLAGAESVWSHSPFFGYIDRFYSIEKSAIGTGLNDLQPFEAAMYAAYNNTSVPDVIAQPQVSPRGGVYLESQQVTLAAGVDGAKIYYTLDGSTPTASSNLYSSPLTIADTTVLKAIVVSGSEVSAVATETYQVGESGSAVSDENWGNLQMAAQLGRFAISFTLVPSTGTIDGVTGLSFGAITDENSYKGLSAIVRFNPSGFMDVRNAGAYTADTTFSYTAGTEYDVTMEIDVPNKSYSVYVSTAGSSEQVVLASNYAFRTEQAETAALDNLAFVTLGQNSHIVKNVKISDLDSIVVYPPKAPTGLIYSVVN